MSNLTVGFDAVLKKIQVDAQVWKNFASDAGKAVVENVTQAMDEMSSPEFRNKLNSSLTTMGKVMHGDTSGLDPQKQKDAETTKMLSQGFAGLENTFKGLLTKSFDILETIFKEMKKSSPLLQAVEQLFNLAMQLFFMPLGNKLGEMLIPAVIELLDNVMAMWDKIDGMDLGEMFSVAVEWGVEALSKFLSNIGEHLISQGGWLADLGHALQGLSSFVKDHLTDVIKLILGVVTTVVSHLGTMIALIGTFMSLHYALQIATMAIIASQTPWSALTGALAVGAISTAAVGTGLSWGIGARIGLANGGYVPPTEGGVAVTVAEAGEGEYVFPESKVVPLDRALASLSTTHIDAETKYTSDSNTKNEVTYITNVYSYSIDEIKTVIKDVLSDEISQSRLRSGY